MRANSVGALDWHSWCLCAQGLERHQNGPQGCVRDGGRQLWGVVGAEEESMDLGVRGLSLVILVNSEVASGKVWSTQSKEGSN